MLNKLAEQQVIIIKQRKEMVELLGFETRNKYEIYGQNNELIGFAAEQQKGFLGILLRQIVGHWRRFDIHIFDAQRIQQFTAHHPFRFYFQSLQIQNSHGSLIGSLEKQFSILSKKFKIINELGQETSTMYSGLFKIWKFPIIREGKEIAVITKKWGGALKEIFIDADSFAIEFMDPAITPEQKAVLLNAAIFIDLLYFENNQGRFNFTDLIPG